jgi:hypothetical protein
VQKNEPERRISPTPATGGVPTTKDDDADHKQGDGVA